MLKVWGNYPLNHQELGNPSMAKLLFQLLQIFQLTTRNQGILAWPSYCFNFYIYIPSLAGICHKIMVRGRYVMKVCP